VLLSQLPRYKRDHGFWIDFIEYGDTYDFLCDVNLFSCGNYFFVALNIARFDPFPFFFLLPFFIGIKIGGSAGFPPIPPALL
jgi:hypothetical protein